MSKRDDLVELFYKDRVAAHRYIFADRHKNETADFHIECIQAFYSPHPKVLYKLFRGAAKSTTIEEATLLSALFKEIHYALVIGVAYDMAVQRISAIKNMCETSDIITELFDNPIGPIWAEGQIVLSNGVKIAAHGAEKSLRGAKENTERPDLMVWDDIESDENVATEAARKKFGKRVRGSFMPALAPGGRIRMAGTPMNPQCLVEKYAKSKAWKTITVPVYYIDGEGQERSSWPSRFPMENIRSTMQEYIDEGNFTEFMQEYMMKPEDEASKQFQSTMMKTGPAPIGYLPKFIIVDPARTTNQKTSARTGYVVVGWVGNKLKVFRAYGAFHKPDEIIKEIFKLYEEFPDTVWVAVEADGLEEFIMQPLRTEQIERGTPLPILPVRAPRDKNAFISALQPFYQAGEVEHVGDCTDLVQELLQFPTGRVDVPNALAYALRLRNGQPVYTDFTASMVFDDLQLAAGREKYLVVSSSPAMTSLILVQVIDGCIRVIRDWVMNAPPLEAFDKLLAEVILEGASKFKCVAAAEQMEKYTNHGVPAVCRSRNLTLMQSPSVMSCEGALIPYMRKQVGGVRGLLVSPKARWTVGGLAMGYSRKFNKHGTLEDCPEDNQYTMVCQSLESFASFINSGIMETEDWTTVSHTADGRPFYSSLPRKS